MKRLLYGMEHEKMFTRAFNTIVVVVITAILVITVFILYRTFEKTTDADIFKFTGNLENTVRRSAAVEYKRYMILIELGKSIENNETDDAFLDVLTEKAAMFRTDGELPNLVSSVGYFLKDSPEKAYEYNFADGDWSTVTDVFNQKEIDHGWEYFTAWNDTSPDVFYIAVENSEDERDVFFRADRAAFIDNYIKESVETSNADFIFEWLWLDDAESAKDLIKYFKPMDSNYSFQPLRILMGMKREQVPMIVEIPEPFERRKIMNNIDVDLPEMESGRPGRPVFFNSGVFVKMTHEKGSYYYDIEYKAAVNFMEAVVIFIIIGVLFMLLLFQLQRIRILRSKEKEFVASITHELRTPLTVIRSAADNLKTGIVPADKLKIYGGLITDQSKRLGNMIEEILLYSNFEEKRKRTNNPVTVDFSVLFSQVRPSLDAVAASVGSTLYWDISGLPVTAETHPEILTLAINNLVANSVNHAYGSTGGSIRIILKYLIPGKLRLVVEDDGRGIEPRELKRIFDPFYRDAVSRQQQDKGSGLGLFLVKRKAQLVEGRLTVESPYKRIDGSKPSGCRFTLTIPCTTKEQADG